MQERLLKTFPDDWFYCVIYNSFFSPGTLFKIQVTIPPNTILTTHHPKEINNDGIRLFMNVSYG